MAEYIEREAAVKALLKDAAFCVRHLQDGEGRGYIGASKTIESIPADDVAPVRRGAWEGTADGYADGELVYDMWNCSECGFDADGAEEKPNWKFCPNCGARMDGRC